MKNEFYDIAFRKKIYRSLDELQMDDRTQKRRTLRSVLF